MTNNMERMRFEIARAIITCFPKDYIEMAFVGGVSEKEFVDENTGKKKKYKTREIEEGLKDIGLSPFDGCGCHEENFMNTVSKQLGYFLHYLLNL